MPIKEFEGIRKFARLGKVRLGYIGEKEITDKRTGEVKTVTFPVNQPFFSVRADDGITGTDMADIFERQYGKEPTAVLAEFPLSDRDKVFSHWMKRYGTGGRLLCRGDGEVALTNDPEKPGEMMDIVCNPETCPYAQGGDCDHVGNLLVLLPELPGWGVWQMDIHGWNCIVQILSLMDELEGMHTALLGKPGLVGIPFKLTKKPYTAHPWVLDKKTGQKKQITTNTYIVSYELPRVRLSDIRAQLAERVQGLAALNWSADNPLADTNNAVEASHMARRAIAPPEPMTDEEIEREKATLFGSAEPITTKPAKAVEPVLDDRKQPDLASCIGTDAWTDHPAPRPWDAETVKSEIARRAEWNAKHPKWSKLATKDPSQDALDFLRSLAGQAMRDEGKRHSTYMYLLGVDSSSKMTAAQVSSLIWWIKNGTNGPNEFAAKEAEACVTARKVEMGQQSLFDEGDAGSVEETNGTA